MNTYQAMLTLLLATLIMGCEIEESSNCEPMTCTLEFRMVGMSFTDKDGKPTGAKDFHAINQRTGDTIKNDHANHPNLPIGSFIVVTDAEVKNLSVKGDSIKVSATSEATGQTKSAMLKVSGGKCACHIEKLSGPETVAFD